MKYPNERKGSMPIEQTDRLGHFHQTDYVTIEFSFWEYIIPRASLTIIEGFHTSEKIEEMIDKNAREDAGFNEEEGSHNPKLMGFTCRAADLVHLAKEIIKTYESKPA
jgi:hypothetical protein